MQKHMDVREKGKGLFLLTNMITYAEYSKECTKRCEG